MKKIFTLLASALVASSALAQTVTLDANRVATFYKTYDGTAFATDPDKSCIAYWRVGKGDGTNQNYKQFPISFDGGAPLDMNDITLTKDYTDPETGFSVPAGHYSTLCCNDYISSAQTRKTIRLSNTETEPLYNIRKLIVYVAGIGAGKADDGTLYQDGIRINGTYIYDGDSKLKNSVSGEQATYGWLTRYVYSGVITSAGSVPVYNATNKSITSNTFTQDKLFRIVIDFKTPHNPDDAHEGYDHDGADNVSNNVGDGSPEQTIDRACIDTKTGLATCDERVYNVCHKFEDPDGDGTTGTGGKAGYYSYDWTWSKTIGQLLQLKKSYNLFAVALICGDENAKTYVSNTVDKNKATWVEVSPTGINNVAADNITSAPRKHIENGRIVIGNYNIAGQRVK